MAVGASRYNSSKVILARVPVDIKQCIIVVSEQFDVGEGDG